MVVANAAGAGAPWALPSDTDPYLQWAAASQFRDHATLGAVHDRLPGADRVVVAIELRAGFTAADLFAQLQAAAPDAAEIADIYLQDGEARHLTAAIQCANWPNCWTALQNTCARVNLALDQQPGRPVRRALPIAGWAPAPVDEKGNPIPAAPATSVNTVIGIIDAGFAFAHRDLRRSEGRTRIRALWDQDSLPDFAPLPGGVPLDFGYGREVGHAALQAALDAHAVAGGAPGSTHEDACYEACGVRDLRHRFSHGTAVASLLLGPSTAVDRLPRGPGQSPARQIGAAASRPAAAEADAAPDVVLVQMPRGATQDGAGHGLAAHVIDAVRYILARAGDAQHVVINLSYAYQTGPHDGSQLLERALDALVEHFEAYVTGRQLDIVLPAGNTFLDRCHARLEPAVADALAPGGDAALPAGGWRQELTLTVPPDNEVCSYVELWLPEASGDALSVEVRLPDGTLLPALARAGGATFLHPALDQMAPPAPSRAALIHDLGGTRGGVAAGPDRPGTRLCLLAIGPTLDWAEPQRTAPAGRWQITVRTATRPETAGHAWIAFSQRVAGAVPRAHQARFVDAGWDPARFLRPALDDAAAPVGPVRRRGSLSGIATGQHSVVVAGTLRRPGQKELAPVAGGLFPPREHAFYSGAPEVHAAGVRSLSAASEESWAVAGIPTAGSRSGSTVRARGTSFASPQVARALAEGVHPLPALSLKRPSTTPVLTGDGTYEADD